MDPASGRIYSPEEIEDLAPEIKERLVPATKEDFLNQKSNHETGLAADFNHHGAMKQAIENLQNAVTQPEEEFDVQKEAEELGELLEEMDRVVNLPDPPPEQFYPINRAARRDYEKRNKALKKRKPNG